MSFPPVATLAELAPFALAAAWWLLSAISALVFVTVLAKGTQLHRASAANRKFGAAFRTATDLDAAGKIGNDRGGCAGVADVGLGVLRHERGPNRQRLLELNLERQARREERKLESGLGLLANLRKAAIFVGLLGTLPGILVVPPERSLPPIVIGLAIAIPAWLASKFFELRVRSIASDLDDFAGDFLNLAQRRSLNATVSSCKSFRPQPMIDSRKSS